MFSINDTVHKKHLDVLFTDKPGKSKIFNGIMSIPIIYDPYDQGWYLHCLVDKSPSLNQQYGTKYIQKSIYTEFENRILNLRSQENKYTFTNDIPQYSIKETVSIIARLIGHNMVSDVYHGPSAGSQEFYCWSHNVNKNLFLDYPRTMAVNNNSNIPEMGTQPSGELTNKNPTIKARNYRKLDQSRDEEDGWIRYYLGTKQKLGKKAAWTALKFHEHHCHPGNHEDCPHCKTAKSGKRRQYKQTDPHIPCRRGEVFYIDGTTYPVRSFQGSKYSIILRDPMSKYFGYIPIVFRNEAPYAIESWIQTMRSDPIFRVEGYELGSRIVLDLGGE